MPKVVKYKPEINKFVSTKTENGFKSKLLYN